MTSTQAELMRHASHEIEVAWYGEKSNPASVTIECLTCHTVLFCADDEDE